MRGLPRLDEKPEILRLLSNNEAPSKISKEYDIPLSTVTTWKKELILQKNKEKEFNKKSVNERLRLISGAEFINDAETNITAAISRIVSEDVSDEDWFRVQDTVLRELQKVALKSAEIL